MTEKDAEPFPLPAAEPGNPSLELLPESQVRPEDKVTLTLEHQDGTPVLRATDGNAFPQTIQIVNAAGEPLALYVAGIATNSPPETGAAPRARSFGGDPDYEGVHLQWELPQALTAEQDDTSESPSFPVVPNRWLIVR